MAKYILTDEKIEHFGRTVYEIDREEEAFIEQEYFFNLEREYYCHG